VRTNNQITSNSTNTIEQTNTIITVFVFLGKFNFQVEKVSVK